jgi:glycosyltransferase involved in cell wall biosynthesis
MHLAINGWFWDRPDTGSGQYLRGLVRHLRAADPDLSITLILPEGAPVETMPPGITVQPVTLKGRGHLAKTGFEQQVFPRVAAYVSADLAHVPYWGSPLSSQIPVVVTVHDIIPLVLPEYRGGVLARLYTGMVAAAARGAAAVITDSAASRVDIIRRLGIPPERVRSILLAAGPEFNPDQRGIVDMAIRKKYKLPDSYVLYLGGFDIRKNVRTLLKAYTYVQTGAEGYYPLVLAGRLPTKKTPRLDDPRPWIEAMALGEAVQTIGEVDEADRAALYRMASAFVFPSRYEGFGLPVLEAMACGTPVIAANVSSIPEIVGDAGFLVDPDDARRMGGSILATLLQENVASENRAKGLARAKTFSWNKVAEETLAVYREVVG